MLNIPVIPLEHIAEHVQCRSCRTRYRLEVLALPTTAEMQAALPAAVLAAATIMLQAGDPASGQARGRAIDIVRVAGLSGFDDAALTAHLAGAGGPQAGHPEAGEPEAGHPDAGALAAPLGNLVLQLIRPAAEWFLADAVRIGLADGPLTDAEREAVRAIARQLGLTSAQALGVISLTEQSAAAG